MLRAAIKLEEPNTDKPSKWHSIARHVPGRTNKDCRKRWCATMASVVSKGGWSSEEDRKLLDAVEKHGTKWSFVAAMVETRNSGQCAKRWNDTLNPEIDRSAWSSEEDAKLVNAVNTHGTSWTIIVKSYFPGRTALAAKNRYSHLSRSCQSRRASSPSGSTSSSLDVCEAPSVPLTDSTQSNADMSCNSSDDNSDLSPNSLDQMDFSDALVSSPSSSTPTSSSPSTPPEFSIDTDPQSDNQMLERFLSGLAGSSEFDANFKLGELSFPDEFMSSSGLGSMVQSFQDPSLESCLPGPDCSLSNTPGFGTGSFVNQELNSSLWTELKDFDLSTFDYSSQRSSSGLESPTLSSDGSSVNNLGVQQGDFQPDQQVAVAVAICRADNLRPTVQVLIQSLAGALVQPVAPSPLSSSASKT